MHIKKQLAKAIKAKQTQAAIEILLSNPNLLNTLIRGKTPLHRAILSNNLELVKAITGMKGIDLKARTQSNEPSQSNLIPASLACFKNIDENILRHLIHIEAPLFLPNANHLTPFMIAAQNNRLDCVNLLITSGKEIAVNHHTATGETALSFAIKFGTPEMVRSILSIRGVYIDNIVTNQTALLLAAEKGDSNILSVLLQFPGVDLAIDGTEAFEVARKNGHEAASNLILSALINNKLHLIKSLNEKAYNALMQDTLILDYLPYHLQIQISGNNNNETIEIVSFASYLDAIQKSSSQIQFANYLDAICGNPPQIKEEISSILLLGEKQNEADLTHVTKSVSIHGDVYPTLIFVECANSRALGDYVTGAQIAFLIQSYLDSRNMHSQCFLISGDEGVHSLKILYGQDVTIFNRSFPVMTFQAFLSSPYVKNTINFIQIGFCSSPEEMDIKSLISYSRFPLNILHVSHPHATSKFKVNVEASKNYWLSYGKKVVGLYTGFGNERIGLPIVLEKPNQKLSKNFNTSRPYGFAYPNPEQDGAHQFVIDYILLTKKSAQEFIIIDKRI